MNVQDNSSSLGGHKKQETPTPEPGSLGSNPNSTMYLPCEPLYSSFLTNSMKLLSHVRLFVTPLTSLPGFSIYGIFQARVLKWVAISFSIKQEQ